MSNIFERRFLCIFVYTYTYIGTIFVKRTYFWKTIIVYVNTRILAQIEKATQTLVSNENCLVLFIYDNDTNDTDANVDDDDDDVIHDNMSDNCRIFRCFENCSCTDWGTLTAIAFNMQRTLNEFIRNIQSTMCMIMITIKANESKFISNFYIHR